MTFLAVFAVSALTLAGTPTDWFFDENYGELLPGSTERISLWRVSSARKVPRWRKVPCARSRGIGVRSAANEAEAVQLVVTPKKPLVDVKVRLGELPVSKAGNELALYAFEILRVGYVCVKKKGTGADSPVLWPDALPVQSKDHSLAVPAAANQPFWIRVKPPKGTAKGIYRSRLFVECTYENGTYDTLEVPFAVEVFGFSMPEIYSCRAAFGYGMEIYAYHNAKTPSQKVAVMDGYFSFMRENHLMSVSALTGKHSSAPGKDGEENIMVTYSASDSLEDFSACRVNGEFIDQPGAGLRAWFWQAWIKGVRAVIFRNAVAWNSKSVYPDPDRPQNPYLDAQLPLPGRGEGTGPGLGWGRYLYPPENCFKRGADGVLTNELVKDRVCYLSPAGSLRLDMIRDGIEDYEYLVRLKSLDRGNALLDVPVHTLLPEALELHRVKIAREIERLTKKVE